MSDTDFKPWGMEPRVFTCLMHLSPLAGLVVPFGGLVLFLVMWLTNKDKSAYVDNHGKAILNWMLSVLIYATVGCILVCLFIGIPLLFALGICSLVFIIMGAVKANGGIVWKYPLAISFFKVDTSVTG